MKRIIELPDEVVKAIQNGEDYRYDIHTAIAQSIPYNPTGDLISREALKVKFQKSCCGQCNLCGYCGVGGDCALIDNAPSIGENQNEQI